MGDYTKLYKPSENGFSWEIVTQLGLFKLVIRGREPNASLSERFMAHEAAKVLRKRFPGSRI